MSAWRVIRVVCLTFCCLAGSPAMADWACEITSAFVCDGAGKCAPDKVPLAISIDDKATQYRRCRDTCEDFTVKIARDFFGSTYSHEKDGILANRSRSGEFTEVLLAQGRGIRALAFGGCRWR